MHNTKRKGETCGMNDVETQRTPSAPTERVQDSDVKTATDYDSLCYR